MQLHQNSQQREQQFTGLSLQWGGEEVYEISHKVCIYFYRSILGYNLDLKNPPPTIYHPTIYLKQTEIKLFDFKRFHTWI